MPTINISKDEEIIFKDFKEGNSVQVRVTVPPGEEKNYTKGTTVEVIHGENRNDAKIVSDPLVIGSPLVDEKRTISLIVEMI